MREQFISELGQILAHIRFEPPGEFYFDGRIPETAQSVALGMPTRLQHWLYQNCFCNRLTEGNLLSPPSNAMPVNNLVAELSQANLGQDAWDSGWEITEVLPNGQVRATKRDTARDFWPGEFITAEGPGLAPRAGMHLKAFFPRESANMQPAFYFAFGNSAEEEFEELSIVRFYWAVQSAGAAALMKEVTGRLNRFQVPFRLKMPVDGSFYNRLDAAVLYINKRFYQITAVLLARVHHVIRGYLVPSTPLFTKPLAPGLGLAEDPGQAESFGMQRCRLLAEAISAAYLNPSQTGAPQETVLEAVVHRLELAGVRADFPYLSPGSVDQYLFSLENGNA
jgi:hypothetical protein